MAEITIMIETLKYLKFNQIWPSDFGSKNWKVFYYFRFILVTLSTSILIVGSTLHLVNYTIFHGSTDMFKDDLIMIVAQIGLYYFVITFVPHQEKLRKVLEQLSSEEKFGKPEDLEEQNKRFEFLCRIYKASFDFAIISYFVEPFLTKKSCLAKNEYRKYKEVSCGMVGTIWLPVDINQTPLKQFLYMWQTFSLLMTYKGAGVIAFFIMESMHHLVLRIRHFKILLKEAIQTEDEVLRAKRWEHCVLYHRQIFQWGAIFDSSFQPCLFAHVIATGIVLALIGFIMMTDGLSYRYSSLLAGMLVSTAMVSMFGQNLYDESLSVCDVLYNSDWYEKQIRFQKDMLFMIMRSQRAVKIHAGPFSELSNVFILAVLKTAYSYNALLLSTSKK